MPTKRPYDQFCPIASALDAIGDRWTLLVVRELFVGPIRYSDLLRSLEPISTDVLTNRLRALDAIDVLRRGDDGRYELTASGRSLAPVLRALGAWGSIRLRQPRTTGDLVAARALQLLAIARADLATDEHTLEVRADDLVATIHTGPNGWIIRRESDAEPDAVVSLDGATLWRLAAGDLDWNEAVSSGAAVIEGDPRGPRALLAGTIPGLVDLDL